MEKEIQKLYFSPKEVSNIIGEPTWTVRFWATEFGMRQRGIKYNTNYTVYTRAMLAKLHIIKTLLRVDKYTIEGAKTKFNAINK